MIFGRWIRDAGLWTQSVLGSCKRMYNFLPQNFPRSQVLKILKCCFFAFSCLLFYFLAMHFFAFHAVTCLFLMLLNFDDIFAGCQAAVLGRGSHFSSVGYSALNNPQSILKIAISCLQQFSLKPCPAWHKFHVHFQWIQRHQMYCQWTNQCSLMQCKYPNPQIWKRNSKYQQKDKSDCFTKADEAPAEFSQNASSELADSEFSLVFVRSPFLIMWWCNCIWFWVFVDFFSEGVHCQYWCCLRRLICTHLSPVKGDAINVNADI